MKSKIFFQISIVIFLIGLKFQGYGQEPAEVQKKRKQIIEYYQKTLEIDSVKAGKVLQIQENYRTEMRKLAADSTIKVEVRTAKVRSLIDVKNQQLHLLLTPAQQKLAIPAMERRKNIEQPQSPKSVN